MPGDEAACKLQYWEYIQVRYLKFYITYLTYFLIVKMVIKHNALKYHTMFWTQLPYVIYFCDYDSSLHFSTLCPSATNLFDLNARKHDSNSNHYGKNMCFSFKAQIASYDVELNTKIIVTMMDTMIRWAIDLWWIKISPTHPCFILMNRKERAYEKRTFKLWKRQLSLNACYN